MKREKLALFFKTKGFYVSMFAGICAVFVIAMVYLNILSINKQSDKNLADLNEPANELAEGNKQQNNTNLDKDPVQDEKSQTAKNSDDKNATPADDVAETEDVTDSTEVADNSEVVELESSYGDPEDSSAEVSSVNQSQNILQSLSFDEENGLLWPVEGNIIKNYSVDKLIYFETLGQFKCNPAVMIDAKPGTDVFCAAKGVVSDISSKEETGLTVTMQIGSEYEVTYGQLQDIEYKVGDLIEEGDLIGKIAKPTKYYSVEGSNLYLQVMENGESVNPLLLLR